MSARAGRKGPRLLVGWLIDAGDLGPTQRRRLVSRGWASQPGWAGEGAAREGAPAGAGGGAVSPVRLAHPGCIQIPIIDDDAGVPAIIATRFRGVGASKLPV